MTHVRATPDSVDMIIDVSATQSARIEFAERLREAASLLEQRELRPTERIGFSHIELLIWREDKE